MVQAVSYLTRSTSKETKVYDSNKLQIPFLSLEGNQLRIFGMLGLEHIFRWCSSGWDSDEVLFCSWGDSGDGTGRSGELPSWPRTAAGGKRCPCKSHRSDFSKVYVRMSGFGL